MSVGGRPRLLTDTREGRRGGWPRTSCCTNSLLVSLRLAERAVSPCPAAEGSARADGSPVGPGPAVSIKGMRIEAQAKAKPARPSRAHPAKPKGCQQHPKVRNYNLKD